MNKRPSKKLFGGKLSQTRSLRTRLMLGNMVITILAITGMGYYVYYRAQQANTFLTTQLDQNVQQQAREKLTAASSEQSIYLDNFFLSIRRDITTLGAALGKMLSQTTETGYWDAAQSLSLLPSGSLDNSNNEPASVFIPQNTPLTDSLALELNTARQIDFIVPPLLEANPDVVAIYFGGTSGETIYYPNIDLANIVPPDFDVTKRPWFVKATPAQNPERKAVWSDPYLDAALHGLVITSSTPIYDDRGNFRGVTAMDIQLNRITEIVADIQVGETGYAFLIDKNMRLIAMPLNGYQDLGILPEALPLGETLDQTKVTAQVSPEFWGLMADMADGKSGLATISIGGSERFIVYQPIPEVGYSLAIIVPTQELLADAIAANEQIAQGTRRTVVVSIFLSIAILAAALLATLGIGNRLTRPLVALTQTAEEISGGNINVEAKVGERGEIGTLAQAFNAMTARLRDMIENLETRVAERTSNIERRAILLQTAAEVGHSVASTRDINALLTQTTHLISQRFGFYHVGIFLLDERGEFAVLQAANSEGGRRMLERGHKLRVGQTGIVGYVTAQGQARIALDVGDDAVFFDNPDLPQTRSEMALPLIASGATLGAIDVQSEKSGAFGEEDIATLQVMADQIAIAIENARLFTEGQAALESARRAYGEVSRKGWRQWLDEKAEIGYFISSADKVTPASPATDDPGFAQAVQSGQAVRAEDGATVFVPLRVRGEAIGALRLAKPPEEKWSDEELALTNTLAGQLGAALESARLYEETASRAERERTVTEITTKIRGATDPQTMLETAMEELRQILGVEDIRIRSLVPQKDKETGEDRVDQTV
ncbi:MAG: hypothetical protein FD146_656 [Anaerolineaceae bacterium]|nr:MAG: hypothetical protein FD146_656 [Anaerolineaceae bacterium]